jgi:hypothetical protein
MAVEDPKGNAETFGQVKKRIVEYAEKAEFGSAEYKALCDYKDLQLLKEYLRTDLHNLASEKDASTRTLYESEVQINVMQTALLHNSIRENQRDIKGYDEAYMWVTSVFESHLPLAIHRETEDQFPDDDQRRDGEARNLHEDVFSALQDSIYRKRE